MLHDRPKKEFHTQPYLTLAQCVATEKETEEFLSNQIRASHKKNIDAAITMLQIFQVITDDAQQVDAFERAETMSLQINA